MTAPSRLHRADGLLTDVLAELAHAEREADPIDAGALRAASLQLHAIARRLRRIALQATWGSGGAT